ncbi:MAG: response regulator [Candidatus Magasanikbacteria bacterium]|jgi:DNA-binding response OmpR family regulator|nr:response regulator [Candidatus Magasanikbacteria bacterium]MBT4315092.1 response regulator [Candidatus Magasanikbacteria bacterium]MBT4547002.1 response regulator [Candidatus Magasanikbacteria bacterium]MBT6818772.1 response regulator [Candidatus Magasanikbacteria bacterium]
MSKKKILIVEDEVSLLNALALKFSQEDMTVLEAFDGEEGLSLAEKEKPDMILLDIVMPKMDGMTMLKKLREEDWGKKIPVIILTNLSESEKVGEASKEGVYDFLVKTNWHINDVVKKVKEKLKIK